MNKKISLGIALGLMVLAIAVSSAVSVGLMNKEYNKLLSGIPEKMERYEIIDELDDIINKNYYGSSEQENLEAAIGQGYVEALGDGESRYMTAEQYSDYLLEKSGNMQGIGIEYTKTREGYLEITRVHGASPASTAGLRTGDIIIAFDGIMIDAENYDEMVAKLEGDKLTSVNFIYKRGETETGISLVKGYEAASVSSAVYENMGYIEISDFYSTTAEQVKQAVDRFITSGLQGMVIDLRSNGSNNYEVAVETLDIFLPISDTQKVATVVDENGALLKTYTTTAGEVNIPVAVLISDKTAAAAELFACSMREFSKGVIVGPGESEGNCLVQEIFELSGGGAVLLTTGKILPASLEGWEKTGLTPDYYCAEGEKGATPAEDSQFLYAVSVIE